MVFTGLVIMKFNSSPQKLLVIVLALGALSLFTGCGSKNRTPINTKKTTPSEESTTTKPEETTVAPIAKAPENPKVLVSPTNEYDQLPDDVKEQYEPPAKEIKIKDKVIKRGHSIFSNVTYVADGTNVKITGQFKLVDVENISNEDTFDFEFKGAVEDNNRKILIKMYDVDGRKKNRVRLGARVICLNYDETNLVDCSEAVVDFFGKVKETEFTHQLQTERKLKPKKVVVPPPVAPPVVEEPPPADPSQPPPPTAQIPPKVDDHDEDGVPKEGQEDSLNGNHDTHAGSEDDLDEISEEEPKKDEPAKPAVPKKEKPKITKDGLLITSEGTLRPVDQAVAYPDDGKLVQATDLALQQRQMKETELYNIVHEGRKKYYATFEMAQMISKLGLFTSQKFRKRLAVGNLSLPKGGESPPHASHQNGTDGDFGYPTDDPDVWFPSVVKGGRFNPSVYSATKTLDLLENAFKQTVVPVDRIFMDQLIINDLCKVAKKNQYFDPGSSDPKWTEKNEFWKNIFRNIQHIDGHGDHMHVRIKCTPQSQRLCQPKIYRKVTHCQS